MTASNCDRWMTMTDRAALGELLSDADRRWLTDHAASCAECGQESRFWSSLGSVMIHPEILELPVTEASSETRKKRTTAAAAWLQGRHSWAFGLAAGIALTLTAAGFLRERPKAAVAEPVVPAARLVSIAGKVLLGSRPARAGQIVSATEFVKTEQGLACIAVSPSITACLDTNSEATLSLEEPKQLAVRLNKGRLMSRLDRQPLGSTYRVETPKAVIVAKGTVFSVGLDVQRGVTVRLHEGRVWMQTPTHQTEALTAPSQAVIRQEIRVEAWSDQAVTDDRVLLALSSLPRSGKRTRLDVMTRPAGANVMVDDLTLGPTPVSAYLADGNRLAVSLDGYAPVTELLPTEPQATIERSFELAATESAPEPADSEQKASAPPLASSSSPSALLARAQALRSQGKYRECAATYRQLVASFPRSDEARVSFVSLGELELSELGQPGRALRSFDSYLRMGGPLTREARYGKIRALQMLGRDSEQQSAIAEFLRDYPNSVQAASIRSRQQTRQP
jgi:ferric-dicitrate binding protein FerR (iron transport regulator)